MVIGLVVAAAVPVLLETVVTAELNNAATKPSKVKPGEFLKLALNIQALSESGLVPVLSVDPFSGDTVLSTSDQAAGLFDLLGTKFAREFLAPTPAEIEEIRVARDASIALGQGPSVQPVTAPTLRDEVVQALAPSTGRVVAPGVVAKKSSGLAVSTRLGGPCAAANTGFSRLNCARGGFA